MIRKSKYHFYDLFECLRNRLFDCDLAEVTEQDVLDAFTNFQPPAKLSNREASILLMRLDSDLTPVEVQRKLYDAQEKYDARKIQLEVQRLLKPKKRWWQIFKR